jgi:hypothetical protein
MMFLLSKSNISSTFLLGKRWSFLGDQVRFHKVTTITSLRNTDGIIANLLSVNIFLLSQSRSYKWNPKSKNKTYLVGDSITLSENKLMRGCGLIFHWSESLLCEICLVTFDVSAKWLFLKLPWPLFMRPLIITQWLMKLVSSWWSWETDHDLLHNSISNRSLRFIHLLFTRLDSKLKILLKVLKRVCVLTEILLDMQKP